MQRSFDGSNFTDVKFVIGAGNSSSKISYNTTDVPGRTGRVYYRVKQADQDGNSKLSNIVSVLFSNGDIVKVYPNPAQQQVIIEGAATFNRIEVPEGTGRLLWDIAPPGLIDDFYASQNNTKTY